MARPEDHPAPAAGTGAAHQHLGGAVRGTAMKRILTISFVALVVLVAGHAISAQQQFGGAQLAVPEIPFDSVPNFLKMPDKLYLGEVAGVATNSKGHVFVYTRTGTDGDDGRFACPGAWRLAPLRV